MSNTEIKGIIEIISSVYNICQEFRNSKKFGDGPDLLKIGIEVLKIMFWVSMLVCKFWMPPVDPA
jgi:hypothetical protein